MYVERSIPWIHFTFNTLRNISYTYTYIMCLFVYRIRDVIRSLRNGDSYAFICGRAGKATLNHKNKGNRTQPFRKPERKMRLGKLMGVQIDKRGKPYVYIQAFVLKLQLRSTVLTLLLREHTKALRRPFDQLTFIWTTDSQSFWLIENRIEKYLE